LSRPAELTVTSRGKGISWEQALSAIKLSSNATRVDLSGTWKSALANKQTVHLNTKVSIEFDGLMLYEISVPEGEGKDIENITIDIPLLNNIAVYRHRFGWAWKDVASYSGSLPKTTGVIERSKFIPFYWFGDDYRGLFWFSESDEMWPNGRNNDAIQVIRTDKELLLRLVIKKATQTLPPNWKLVFGLQATPVKPIPKNWRSIRLAPARKANINIVWPEPTKASLLYYGYPEAADQKIFAERIRELNAKRIKAAPYVCLTHLSTASPEWQKYASQWSTSQFDTESGDVKAFGASFAKVSPTGSGWSDFIVWKTKRFMDQHGITSIYHDNTQPYGCAAPVNGVGYMRDGKPQMAFPILGYRSLYRRMYSVIKRNPKQTFTIAHMSSKVTIPILAYEDAYLDGEQFGDVVKDNYLDVLTLDAFRVEFVGQQWGLIPIFLPEFRPPYIDKVEPTRGLMALLMIHDVAIWPLWCNLDVVNEALYALDEFGYSNAEFIPYFDAVPPAASTLKDVYVSAYKRPDGKVLLIIGNLGKESREGEITINTKRLGIKTDKIITWPDKQQISLKGDGVIRVYIPRQGYRMVVLNNLK
jgi:hypothetical protein